VSPAFAEDPLRILRVARFAARFTDFHIAPETLALMRHIVALGEVDHLVAERVWQEFARGLMESHPSRMILALRECGALAHILPEVERLFGVPQPEKHHPEIDTGEHVLQVIDHAASMGLPLAARWACLLHDLGKGDTPAEILPHHYGHEAKSAERARAVSERLRAPIECRDLAVMLAREHGILGQADILRPETMVKVLERCDALRRPERFLLMLDAASSDFFGRRRTDEKIRDAAPREWPPAARWRAAVGAIRAVDAGAIAGACANKAQIPAAVHGARIAAVRALARPQPVQQGDR
jgi:tRNA nucleotidyltransferase (CCA-adding enzyme)